MKNFSLIGGIGSLSYAARKAGFEVIGGYDWRKYYHTGTWEKNYNTDFTQNLEDWDLSKLKGIDLVTSHPECGAYSNLSSSKKQRLNPMDIPRAISEIAKIQPKFALVDNLPKALYATTPSEIRSMLKDYDVSFEWVSNWGYGNTQKFRNRLYMVISHKDLNYHFVPNEKKHDKVIEDVIGDLINTPRGVVPNHHPVLPTDRSAYKDYMAGRGDKNEKITFAQLNEFIGDWKIRSNLPYYNRKGEYKTKPGYYKTSIDHFAPVLTGGGGFPDNHFINVNGFWRPFTIRERLRIQGFDDDFILVPDKLVPEEKFYLYQIKQTGKCMPIEFAYYFAKQIRDFLDFGILPEKGNRILKPNTHIQNAELW